MYTAQSVPILIVSDCRRKTDIKFFEEMFGRDCVKRIRVEASEQLRKQRGYVFQNGVDDAESECGLDQIDGGFDFILKNDELISEKEILSPIVQWIDIKTTH
jgi:phosphomevalonate kinase